MKVGKTLLPCLLALSLTACSTVDASKSLNDGSGSFCDRNTAVCVIAGAVVVGGIIGLVARSNNSSTPQASPPVPSDARLKEDIRAVATLDNGLKLYSFHYRGDSRLFVSVIAQDLLENARFRSAVFTDAKGFYRVSLAALGVDVLNGTEMVAAGERAERLF